MRADLLSTRGRGRGIHARPLPARLPALTFPIRQKALPRNVSAYSLRILGRGAPNSLGSAPRPTAPPTRCGRGKGRRGFPRLAPATGLARCQTGGGGIQRSGFASTGVSRCPYQRSRIDIGPPGDAHSVGRRYPAMRVRISIPWSPVDVWPVDRDQRVGVGRATATPA